MPLVLLVDDEEAVRATAADMLEDLGYRVEQASSAEQALHLVESGIRPDLLITDHLMPGMKGTQLANELRRKFSEIGVLIVSGYADLESLSTELAHLLKPFRAADLACALADPKLFSTSQGFRPTSAGPDAH